MHLQKLRSYKIIVMLGQFTEIAYGITSLLSCLWCADVRRLAFYPIVMQNSPHYCSSNTAYAVCVRCSFAIWLCKLRLATIYHSKRIVSLGNRKSAIIV